MDVKWDEGKAKELRVKRQRELRIQELTSQRATVEDGDKKAKITMQIAELEGLKDKSQRKEEEKELKLEIRTDVCAKCGGGIGLPNEDKKETGGLEEVPPR